MKLFIRQLVFLFNNEHVLSYTIARNPITPKRREPAACRQLCKSFWGSCTSFRSSQTCLPPTSPRYAELTPPGTSYQEKKKEK